MDIREFKKFVFEEDSGFLVPINIFEEVSNYKKLHGKSPVIIINLTCLPVYAQHNEETLFAGRHDNYRKVVDDFLFKLKSAGAILEFCSIVVTKASSITKKMKKHQEMNFILDEIYKGTSVKETLALNGQYLHLGLMKSNLPAIARKYGGTFKALSYDILNYQMAEKAQKMDAMAVITDTTQLLFFDVPFNIWMGRDLNFEDGTTMRIDRENLLATIGLKSCHLPFLGTLLGADYQLHSSSFLVRFGENCESKLKAIVEFILKRPEKLSRIQITEMSNLLLRPSHRYLFSESFKFFNLNRKWEEPTEKISRFLYFENTVDNFLIVSGYHSVYDVEFFDHRKQDFDEFIKLRTTLLERKAGILLQHKNDRTLRHFYFSRKSHLEMMSKSFFDPVYPEITVPPLDELLCPSDYPELTELRYFLLCWTIDESINKSIISSFNPKYTIDVLALYSGLKYGFIKPFEAKVILMTIDTVIRGRIPELTYPTHINERAMRLAFVYASLHSEISDIVQAVGLDQVEITTRFDGVFYHKLYQEWMDCSKKDLDTIFEGYPHLQEILRFLE